MTDNRATGWKIPLLFCAIILAVVGTTILLRGTKQVEVTPLPAPLLTQAKAIVIDLQATPEGQAWRERITSSAGGFSTHDAKDARLEILIAEAVSQQRYDAACTAAVLIYNDQHRDAVLRKMADAAAQDCTTLPWGAMAAKGMRDPQRQSDTHAMLGQHWETCR